MKLVLIWVVIAIVVLVLVVIPQYKGLVVPVMGRRIKRLCKKYKGAQSMIGTKMGDKKIMQTFIVHQCGF